MDSSSEYRISLVTSDDSSVNIKTWWVTEDKYALLSAALGDPEVDSIYPRAYLDITSASVFQNLRKEDNAD